MSERFKRQKRNLVRAGKLAGAAGLSAVAVMAGAAKANASPDAKVGTSGIEMIDQDRLSLPEAQAQAQMKLEACQDNNFLRGSVVALNPRTGESMFSVDYPVLVLRDQVEVGGKQPSQRVFNHPGDGEHWALGYINDRGTKPTVAMINQQHARLVFKVEPRHENGAPAIDAFRCNLDKTTGQPDPDRPLNVVGQPLNTSAGQPIKIGVRIASGGFLKIPPRK